MSEGNASKDFKNEPTFVKRQPVSHRQAAQLRWGKRAADVGIGHVNPLFIISSYIIRAHPPPPHPAANVDVLLVIYIPITVPNSSFPRLPTPSIHNRHDRRTAFESPTLRYLKHPSYPLQTPHSSCKNTTMLKKNRPAGGGLSTFPCLHPKFPF